jgi:hypothetical protein
MEVSEDGHEDTVEPEAPVPVPAATEPIPLPAPKPADSRNRFYETLFRPKSFWPNLYPAIIDKISSKLCRPIFFYNDG